MDFETKVATEDCWPARAAAGVIGSGEILVFSAGLIVGPAELERLAAILTASERARAARFRDASHAQRWIASRGQLREILEAYLGIDAGHVQLVEGPNGKPFAPQGRLHFNLSHAEDIALYALSPDCAVGVDVEHVVRAPDLRALAEYFFSPAERTALSALPSEEFTLAFYHCWTRKEAYLKATGAGLSVPLDSFDVLIERQPERCALLRQSGDREAPSRWLLRHLTPRPGYVGAVAVQAPDARVSVWRWTRAP